nr:hypothetical protein [Tanacetum cinerariifolium]
MEVCRQNKEGEAENGKKEDELLKVLKQEALQLLKRSTIIKKTKEDKNKKKEEKNKKVVDSEKAKRPTPTQQKYNLTVVVSMGRLWMMILLIKTTHEKNVSRKQKYTQEMEVCKQNKEGEAENGKKEDELLKVLKQEALQLLKRSTIIKDKNKKMEEKNKKVIDFNKPKRPAYSFLIFSSEIIVVAQEPVTLTSSSFPSSENGAMLRGPLAF